MKIKNNNKKSLRLQIHLYDFAQAIMDVGGLKASYITFGITCLQF